MVINPFSLARMTFKLAGMPGGVGARIKQIVGVGCKSVKFMHCTGDGEKRKESFNRCSVVEFGMRNEG